MPVPGAQRGPLCNLLLFKPGWVLLVVWQDRALIPATLLLGLSLLLHPALKTAALPALCIAASGMLLDQMLTFAGILVFPDGTIPAWLLLLWLLYGQALTLGFGFLQALPWWAQVPTGALCGAGSYSAGLYFGAVDTTLPHVLLALVTGALWALLLPLHLRLVQVAGRFPAIPHQLPGESR